MQKNELLLNDVMEFAALTSHFNKYANAELEAKIKQIASKFGAENPSVKPSKVSVNAVMNNVIAIAAINRALETNTVLPTMSKVLEQKVKGFPYGREIMGVRQLVFMGYRNVHNIKPGIEYNSDEFVRECALSNSAALLVACELIASGVNEFDNGMHLSKSKLTLTEDEVAIANNILAKKQNIINLGTQYSQFMSQTSHEVDVLTGVRSAAARRK